MSANPVSEARPSETIAGFLATFAIFASLIGLVRNPVLLTTAGILLSVIAAGMGGQRHARLSAAALAIASTCFVLGMVIAIVANRSLW